jgi:hypothetical protein
MEEAKTWIELQDQKEMKSHVLCELIEHKTAF